jgi:hypothetical protein
VTMIRLAPNLTESIRLAAISSQVREGEHPTSRDHSLTFQPAFVAGLREDGEAVMTVL